MVTFAMEVAASPAILVRESSIAGWVVYVIIAIAWVIIAAKLPHRATAVLLVL